MKWIYFLLLIFIFNFSFAEIIIIDSIPQLEHDAQLNIKHHVTAEEMAGDGWQVAIESQQAMSLPSYTPPASVLKPVAEFDHMSGVLIRYPLGIPLELIRIISTDTRIITIVNNNNTKNQAISAYTSANVNMNNVEFMLATSESYWTRDYGPWFSYKPDGELNVIDFNYNRPTRPNDNLINTHYALYDSLSIYNMGINHCGGNYMTDGISIGASSHIAYTENGNNFALVNQAMNDYLAINNYHVVQDPNATYIDHIDCWGKFLAPDIVLIRSVPTSHPRYTAIEQTAQYFASQTSSWGTPYKVVRVNTPNNQPYTNSLILNNKVFVPIMNQSFDQQALEAYQNALPGYTIYGVLNNTYNPWESTDALHCRVKELAERHIVYIEHTPLAKEMEYQEEIEISITAHNWTGVPLEEDTPKVLYQINGNRYRTLTMMQRPIRNNEFFAIISNIAPLDTLRYYIQVTDSRGKSFLHPFIGAPMAHQVVFGDADLSDNEITMPVSTMQVAIYPNPIISGKINISISGNKSTKIDVALYNIKGQRKISETFDVGKNIANNLSIDISDFKLSNGVYLLKLKDGSYIETKRVLVIK